MHNAEHRLIRGILTPQDHAVFPHFNASPNMQKFKSQIIFVKIQANRWQLHNSGKGRARQPSTAGTPGEFTRTNPERRQIYTRQDHRTSAISQPSSPQRSPFPLSPGFNECYYNSNLYFSWYKSELFSKIVCVIHSQKNKEKDMVRCSKYRMP